MADDADPMLIRAYVHGRCEESFAELVRRHVNLVHSTALRIVRDPALAEEVTQHAFLALARHSGRLQGRSSLTGWLYETTRNLSINTVRTEERRRLPFAPAVVQRPIQVVVRALNQPRWIAA